MMYETQTYMMRDFCSFRCSISKDLKFDQEKQDLMKIPKILKNINLNFSKISQSIN